MKIKLDPPYMLISAYVGFQPFKGAIDHSESNGLEKLENEPGKSSGIEVERGSNKAAPKVRYFTSKSFAVPKLPDSPSSSLEDKPRSDAAVQKKRHRQPSNFLASNRQQLQLLSRPNAKGQKLLTDQPPKNPSIVTKNRPRFKIRRPLTDKPSKLTRIIWDIQKNGEEGEEEEPVRYIVL